MELHDGSDLGRPMARMRWVEQHKPAIYPPRKRYAYWVVCHPFGGFEGKGRTLDEAIDQAMAESSIRNIEAA